MSTWTDGPVTVLIGDIRERLAELADASVHSVVTSPPYWGLRDYGVPGQLGLEPTADEYICRMVEVFGEVRRVLRPDGTLWCNMGDGYAANVASARPPAATNTRGGLRGAPDAWTGRNATPVKHPTKPKDLVMMPARLALALQADGWWLRSDIIWAKPNPMPESVTDRPTTAHEHVFLLARSERYFYDAEAVREPLKPKTFTTFGTVRHDPGDGSGLVKSENYGRDVPERRPRLNGDGSIAGANAKSVWTIATQPYPEAHFATFPEELARRCIAAGTSERGCCPECGAPWRRVVDVGYENPGSRTTNGPRSLERRDETAGFPVRLERRTATTGWQPTCVHDDETVACTVLDPFAGSGTTLAVARRMGRRAVGIELQADYLPLIRRRVEAAARPPLLEYLDAQTARRLGSQ